MQKSVIPVFLKLIVSYFLPSKSDFTEAKGHGNISIIGRLYN
ncbi:hypothetical protein [Viridibacillus arvi]